MPIFSLVGQYIKDLSFENLVSKELPQDGTEPSLQVNADVEYTPFSGISQLAQNGYEVVLTLHVTMTLGDKNLFIAELKYSGIVQFSQLYPEAQLEPVLYIEIPYYLFFEARNLIASLAAQAGFGPIFLRPVDFSQVYMSRSKFADKHAEVNA